MIEWITTHAAMIGSSIMILWAVRGLYVQAVQQYVQAVQREIQRRVGRAFSPMDQVLIALEMLDIIDSEQIPLQAVLADPDRFAEVMERAITRLAQRGAIVDHPMREGLEECSLQSFPAQRRFPRRH